MYGLLLDSMRQAITTLYDVDTWEDARKEADVTSCHFLTHETYPDQTIHHLCEAVGRSIATPSSDVLETVGGNFINFVTRAGYDDILHMQGRRLREFIDGVDNLHEYVRRTYPAMQAPSFQCEDETSAGLTVRYRSPRRGLTPYVIGQLKQIGRTFFAVDIDIEVGDTTECDGITNVTLYLRFDNSGFTIHQAKLSAMAKKPRSLFKVSGRNLERLCAFHVLFGRDLTVRAVSTQLTKRLGDFSGKKLQEVFSLLRPPVPLNYELVQSHLNVVFMLRSLTTVNGQRPSPEERIGEGGHPRQTPRLSITDYSEGAPRHTRRMSITDYSEGLPRESIIGNNEEDGCNEWDMRLTLRGQMVPLPGQDAFLFLAQPAFCSVNQAYQMGIYLHEISLYGMGPEILALSSHEFHDNHRENLLERQRSRGHQLAGIVKRLHAERQGADYLLSQMMPREVVVKLQKRGSSVEQICESFDEVTILFIDVVGFIQICQGIPAMTVVALLNVLFTQFDAIIEEHQVYKVETIGDEYMVVSGAPIVSKHHAQNICNMALEMRKVVCYLKSPTAADEAIQLRIGINSGPVVAGVVGLKRPHYCLFGDTVNTASRMKSICEAGQINISEITKNHLPRLLYNVTPRGVIKIKGKGDMHTFYLEEISDELDIDQRRLATPKTSLVTTWSRMTSRATSLHPESGIVIPDFIPVTPEEVNRKSMQNDRLAARLRAVFATRRSTATMTHDQHHSMTSETGHVNDNPTASVEAARRRTFPISLERDRPTIAHGRSSEPSPGVGQGTSAAIGTLFARFNAAIAARGGSLNVAQKYSGSTQKEPHSAQKELRPTTQRKDMSTQTEDPCAPTGNKPARTCALL